MTAACSSFVTVSDVSPPKRKVAGRFAKKGSKKTRKITIVKCGLKSIFQKDRNNERIMAVIDDMCLRSTRIRVIASLIVLDFVNRSADNFDIFNGFASPYIHNAFHAASAPTARSDNSAFMSPQFHALLQQYNIQRSSASLLGNPLKYLAQMYETTFFTNVKTHAQNRIVKLFKLWFIQANNVKPDKRQSKQMVNAVKFMFNDRSVVPRNATLTTQFLNYLPPEIEAIVDSNERGFMGPMLSNQNWFKLVPVFIEIQRDTYHALCREYGDRIKLRNFTVVPIHSLRMKHIRIDSSGFKTIL